MFKGSTTMNLELIKSLYYLKSYFSLYGKIEESFLCAAFIPFLATSFFICRVLPTGRMGGGESLHQLKICFGGGGRHAGVL